MGRRGRSRGTMLLAGFLGVIAAVPSAPASPSGSTGVTSTVLAHGVSEKRLKLKAKGTADVIVRTITIDPGGSTGWHYHEGQLLIVVTAGTLTRTFEDCSVEITPAGSAFVEVAGAEHRHIGRNLGTEPVVLHATYVLPKGSPLAVDTEAPSCAGE
ncbi:MULTISPECIES: cupin domain-containing protein [Streptomyces]|nr:cupin domain-containing protein [Streptomyces katsurahamanus]